MSGDIEDLEKRKEEERKRRCAAWSRAYRKANKEEIAERRRVRMETDPEFREKELVRRRRSRAALYGISVADYDLMLRRQGGMCAICKRKPAKALCVDHSHATKVVRALLCLGCNSMLGFAGDDPDLLDAGSAYLRAFRTIPGHSVA
jgi:hypothetical protein